MMFSSRIRMEITKLPNGSVHLQQPSLVVFHTTFYVAGIFGQKIQGDPFQLA